MPDPVFALPDRLAAKRDPALIGPDERHLAAVAGALARSIAELSDRLDRGRRDPARDGTAALERDQQIHALTARLRMLRRFGVDLCLGRMVPADRGAPVYVGRLGLTGPEGERLLVDWRSPAAEPFFAATHAAPAGLASRRRYRWADGRITDYWDEVFDPDAVTEHAALDDQSAFLASLGVERTDRMRDVLGTIAADQDAIIRAGSSGALVVDGGPGTGKTVVALHRAAYLLYEDPRLRQERSGGLLFIGPHQPYLDYVGDVLPGLGEDGVRTCTLRDLLPEGATATTEPDEQVARLKESADLVRAIDAAVALYEEPPTEELVVATDWDEVVLGAADWARAFAAPEPGTPHNDARERVWDELVEIVLDRHDPEVPEQDVRASLACNRDLVGALHRAWPLVDAGDLVGDLWSVPAYLRRCAPWLTREQVRTLQRDAPQAWTEADLPLLDAARRRLGDPDAPALRRRQRAAEAAERQQMDRVVEDLIAADDSELLLMTSLRHGDLRDALVDPAAVPVAAGDPLAGPFAHVIVDEAQELTDAQWQMVLARCPSGSLTIVGDRAQSRAGFTEPWHERLARVGVQHHRLATLTVNYRTPAEIMDAAAPVIRAALPDVVVPTSVRHSGVPVTYGAAADVEDLGAAWVREHVDGVACVIGDPGFEPTSRVRSLSPQLAKGLEFDLVVLVDPDAFGEGVTGAVDRYVAMTRATRRLVVLTR